MTNAMQYLHDRLTQATKVGDLVERAQLVEMITAWESKETEADRLNPE